MTLLTSYFAWIVVAFGFLMTVAVVRYLKYVQSDIRRYAYLDHLVSPTLILDKYGNIQFHNRAATLLFDLPDNAQRLSIHDHCHPRQIERDQCPICQSVFLDRPFVSETVEYPSRSWHEISLSAFNHKGERYWIEQHTDITTRKQYELNLQSTYQIISQSGSMVCKWRNRNYLPVEFVTDNTLGILGYTPDELLGKGYLELIHPEDRSRFMGELDLISKDNSSLEVTHLPYRLLRKTGEFIWVQDRKFVSRNIDGQIINYQGVITDINKQRQQSKAIRNIISSNQRPAATSLLENLVLLTAESVGADFLLVVECQEHNPAKVRAFYSENHLVKSPQFALHSEPYADIAVQRSLNLRQNVQQTYPNNLWLRLRHIEGLINVPLLDKRQRYAGYVLAFFMHPIQEPRFAEDILNLFALQIGAELESTRIIKALRDQKRRLVDAQRISMIGDWHWQPGQELVSWSDEMYRLTGTHRSQFILTLDNILQHLVHPDDRQYVKQALKASEENNLIDFQHRIIRSNGQMRHVHQRGRIIRSENQQILSYQGTMQDISDRLAIEEGLTLAKQQAEKAAQVKSVFLANMSHEIRTPMNAIVGLVELCLNSALSEKQREYLQRVEVASHSLLNIIDDILDFSKMEAGRLHLENVSFLLEDMLDQVFSTMQDLCSRKNLTLIRPQTNYLLQPLVGDPQRLRQVLINLIGNAVKFTEQGSIRVEIDTLESTPSSVVLCFAISDTGIGISEEHQRDLFQAFSQADSSITRNYGGTGLGLVICKQLVEQMQGSIRVQSQLGQGSTFSFSVRLGISQQNTLPKALPAPFRVNGAQANRFNDAKLLLVEDNDVNRLVAQEMLRQFGAEVDTAENGKIALEMLSDQAYDLVLMDLQMPVMDGIEAVRQLRSLYRNPVTVIAMTASVMNDVREQCFQVGINDFIAKPIFADSLFNTLDKWLPTKVKVLQTSEQQVGVD